MESCGGASVTLTKQRGGGHFHLLPGSDVLLRYSSTSLCLLARAVRGLTAIGQFPSQGSRWNGVLASPNGLVQ